MSGHGETYTSPQLTPAIHSPFKVGQRVRFKGVGPELDGKTGKIVGIAAVTIAFSYIVKMDEPFPAPPNYPGEPWEALSMIGGCLELEEGPAPLTEFDKLRREVCDAAGKRRAYPAATGSSRDWNRAYEEGRRHEAKTRGWEGLYPEQHSMVFPGHEIQFEATDQYGVDSGRPRYRVTCLSCDKLIHENTTGPEAMAKQHVLDQQP